MKKNNIANILFLIPVLYSGLAISGTLNASIGYAFSKNDEAGTPKGFNLKYGYEWSDSFGMMTSFSYLHSSKDSYQSDHDISFKNEKTDSYYSFGMGPSYRLNSIINFYGLLGFNYARKSNKSNDIDTDESIYYKTKNSTSLMYGTGLNINISNDFLVNIGYERGSYKNENSDNKNSNIYNFNIGYQW